MTESPFDNGGLLTASATPMVNTSGQPIVHFSYEQTKTYNLLVKAIDDGTLNA